MTIYDTKFSDAISNAESELSGMYHYDHTADQEIVIPPKDPKQYLYAYNYCYYALDLLTPLNDVVEEIKLTKRYINAAPEFSEENPQYSLDLLLGFSYKNWIIRINTLGELIIHFASHIYQIEIPSSEGDLLEAIFRTDEVRTNNQLNIALLNIVDFLKMERLHKANGKTIRKNRNKIVHKGEFKHTKMSDLSWLLFEYEVGKAGYDETDLLIDKNVASIEIEREISEFTFNFFDKISDLLVLFEKEFKERFKQLMKDANNR